MKFTIRQWGILTAAVGFPLALLSRSLTENTAFRRGLFHAFDWLFWSLRLDGFRSVCQVPSPSEIPAFSAGETLGTFIQFLAFVGIGVALLIAFIENRPKEGTKND